MGDDDRSEPRQTPCRVAGEPGPSTTQTDGVVTASRLDFRPYAVATRSCAQECADFRVAGPGNGGSEK